MNETDWKLIITAAAMVAGGGVAWGVITSKVGHLADKLRACKTEDIMTAKRCREFHDTRQKTADVKLDTIQKMLNEMKEDRRKFDERLGSLSSKIDVMYDRWERANA